MIGISLVLGRLDFGGSFGPRKSYIVNRKFKSAPHQAQSSLLKPIKDPPPGSLSKLALFAHETGP